VVTLCVEHWTHYPTAPQHARFLGTTNLGTNWGLVAQCGGLFLKLFLKKNGIFTIYKS